LSKYVKASQILYMFTFDTGKQRSSFGIFSGWGCHKWYGTAVQKKPPFVSLQEPLTEVFRSHKAAKTLIISSVVLTRTYSLLSSSLARSLTPKAWF